MPIPEAHPDAVGTRVAVNALAVERGYVFLVVHVAAPAEYCGWASSSRDKETSDVVRFQAAELLVVQIKIDVLGKVGYVGGKHLAQAERRKSLVHGPFVSRGGGARQNPLSKDRIGRIDFEVATSILYKGGYVVEELV